MSVGKKVLVALTFIVASAPLAALATVSVSPNLPGTTPASAGAGGIVANLYQFALLAAGVLALGAIVWGGIKYTWAAGNPSAQHEGKEWIQDAFYGLLLLAGAYIILRTINPAILNLDLPALAPVSVGPVAPLPPPTGICTPANECSDTNVNGCCPNGQSCEAQISDPMNGTISGYLCTGTIIGCPINPLPPITDPAAQAMEATNGNAILWTAPDPNVQKNLDALRVAYNAFLGVIAQPGIRDTATVQSVYRPLAYQKHFYDIFQATQQLNAHPEYASMPECTAVISALHAEQAKHGVCNGSGPCLVNPPVQCAPHAKGTGIDIKLSGPFSESAINPVLAAKGVNLRWQNARGDPVHFNLTVQPWACP